MDSVELNGSHVARSWTVFIDETEKMVKYIKENAEFLANNTIDKINALYAVSRVNGKAYLDAHGLKIQGEGSWGFGQICGGRYIGVVRNLGVHPYRVLLHFYDQIFRTLSPPRPPPPLPVCIYESIVEIRKLFS